MNAEVQQVVDEARALVDAAQRGEHERGLWIAIADKLTEIQRLEPSWGYARIAPLFKRSDGQPHKADWARKIVQWRTSADSESATPFKLSESTEKARDAWHARRTLREDPAKVAPEIAAAMEDPEVVEAVMASPKARAAVRNADPVHRQIKDAQQRAAQRQPTATVSQYYWRILNSFTKWGQGLQWIEEEAHTLRSDERPEVIVRLGRLRDQIDRCLAAVEGRPDDGEATIDSTATDVAARELIAG
jgi:hypothetical protein